MWLFQWVRDALTDHRHSELEQAFIRIVISGLCAIYVYVLIFGAGGAPPIDWRSVTVIIAAHLSASVLIILSILRTPKARPARKVFGIAIDMAVLSFVVSRLGESGMALLPLYLWVIMGNGLRYGLRYLYVAVLLSAVGLLTAIISSDYLSGHLYASVGWLIAVIALPPYFAALLHRINARTEELGRLKQHLEYLADREPLTQLPNRRAFQTLLESRLRKSPPDPNPFALAFVDLDGFKDINDRWGHAVGDEILKQTAVRLQQVSRAGDVVARFGGDEFVMFLENISPDHVRTVAERMVTTLAVPFVHDQHSLQLSASVGVVMHRADGTELATLMRMADEVMYDVKRRGKNAYGICTLNEGWNDRPSR